MMFVVHNFSLFKRKKNVFGVNNWRSLVSKKPEIIMTKIHDLFP